jgi:hypothetical protein
LGAGSFGKLTNPIMKLTQSMSNIFLNSASNKLFVVFCLLALAGCGSNTPSEYDLQRQAISSYSQKFMPYATSLAAKMNNENWAKKGKRKIRKGKTMLFSMHDNKIEFDSTGTYYLPEDLRANDIDDIKTVVLLKGESHVVGRYGAGDNSTDAIQLESIITFIDAKSFKTMKQVSRMGGTPPNQIYYHRSRPKSAMGSGISQDEMYSILRDNLL